jgi:hypothetical protein
MSGFTQEWYRWLELDEKWLPKLTESLKNIEIDGQVQKMSWEEQIEYLVPGWIEKVTKLAPSWVKKVTKSEKQNSTDNQEIANTNSPSPSEKVTKLIPDSIEKVTKLPDKKLQYLIVILLMSGQPIATDDFIEIFLFRDRRFFVRNYIKPLESVGFITKTNPDKPTASNQRYVITEKGKRFLTGQEF